MTRQITEQPLEQHAPMASAQITGALKPLIETVPAEEALDPRRMNLEPARILWLTSSGVGAAGQPSSVMLDAIIDSPFGLIEIHIQGGTSVTTLHSPHMARVKVNADGRPEVETAPRQRGLQLNPRQMAAAMFSCRSRIKHLRPELRALHADTANALEAIGETLTHLHNPNRPALDPELLNRIKLPTATLRAYAQDLYLPPSSEILQARRTEGPNWPTVRFTVQGSFQVIDIHASNELISASIHPLDACSLTPGPEGLGLDACERGLFISVKQASAALFLQRNHLRDTGNYAQAAACAEMAGLLNDMLRAGVPGATRPPREANQETGKEAADKQAADKQAADRQVADKQVADRQVASHQPSKTDEPNGAAPEGSAAVPNLQMGSERTHQASALFDELLDQFEA